MKKLTLQDYQHLKPYFDIAHYDGYNSNFVNMMLWNHEYDIHYHKEQDFLIILLKYKNQYFFAMPFCHKENLKKAIDYMMNYANEHHFPFQIEVAIESFVKDLKDIYPDVFLSVRNRDNDDYVYLKEDLITLKGKKMQKRRNHYNALIKKDISYIYKEIEDQDIDQVLQCLKKWDDHQASSESIQSEAIAIMYALIHRHELNIKTGCIYIDGQLEAFTIGSPLYNDTIEIHFEKANKAIRGLYVLISKLFLENNYPQYLYVNREEDMGIESLRKAKQALHPCHMVHKYTIIPKHLQVRQANINDKDDIYHHWLNTFEDEDIQSSQYYFEHIYQECHTYVLENNDTYIGNMQIRPYKISINGSCIQAYFILGVVIDEKYRHNGCMRYLLSTVCQNYYPHEKLMLQAYHPEIYYSLLFHEQYYNTVYFLNRHDDSCISSCHLVDFKESQQLLSLYNHYTSQYNGFYIRDKDYYDNYMLLRNKALNRKIKLIDNNKDIIGYLEYEAYPNKIVVTEIICPHHFIIEAIQDLLAQNDVELHLSSDIDIHRQGQQYCQMLTNFTYDDEKPLFINEIY